MAKLAIASISADGNPTNNWQLRNVLSVIACLNLPDSIAIAAE